MVVSARGRASDTFHLGLRVMTLTPWVERVVLGVRAAVWKTSAAALGGGHRHLRVLLSAGRPPTRGDLSE